MSGLLLSTNNRQIMYCPELQGTYGDHIKLELQQGNIGGILSSPDTLLINEWTFINFLCRKLRCVQ